MKNHYGQVTRRVGQALLWAGLMTSQTAWAQSVPDAQWARVGNTLAITTDGNIVTSDAGIVVKYALNGDKIAQSGRLQGTTYLAGKLQGCPNCLVNGYAPVESIFRVAPTVDGGVLTLGRECCESHIDLNKLSINLGQESVGRSGYYVIGTPDGGHLTLSAGAEYETVNYQPVYSGRNVAIVGKSGSQSGWSRTIVFPTQNPARPDSSLTKANVVINTPDGGYLVGGYYNSGGDDSPQIGWLAKLDGQGNISWQKLLEGLPHATNFSGFVPRSIYQMRTVTDIALAATGNGYAIAGLGIEPAKFPPPAMPSILEINGDGSYRKAKSIGGGATDPFIALYTGSDGKKYYAVGNTSLQNGADPQVSLISTADLPQNNLALFNVDARRTFEGPGDGPLTGIATAGDGSIVFVTRNNQVVKLSTETFRLTQPAYDCQTGAITFNTTGSNGSIITYSAPGIMRSSATSNSGTVESGLRNDPKVIVITATQNGISVTYNFDLRAACSSTPGPKPPVYNTIPDQSYVVGLPIFFQIGSYFSDPTTGVPNYSPVWSFQAEGLPDGLELSNRSYSTPNVPILGTPTKAGVYTVTVIASINTFPNSPIRATFRITVSSNGTQPPIDPNTGNALVFLAPTYNCQSGVITLRTSGGDGSVITYSAPGIMRSSATSNTGTVEPGLRNDPKTIVLMATQNGQTANYTFDLKAACDGTQPPVDPPTGTSLALLAPTYDCASGAIVFRTSGGNGSTIEYMAPGITGWTSNPNQFVDRDSRTASDVKPFTLMARQNGVVVSYVWDLRGACGRVQARLGGGERVSELSVSVLGNPVGGQSAEIDIRGASGQTVQLNLVDLQGRVLHQRIIGQAGSAERVSVPVGDGNGLLLLNVSTATQRQQIKILKP